MVAYSGTQNGERWQLAPSLRRLIEETDLLFPNRSIVSDGSIGNDAHQARQSDHNPGSDNIVSAVDITDDDASGCDVGKLWVALIARKDKRVKYLIHRGEIVKSYRDDYGHTPWEPYPYTGPNGHFTHLHVSNLDEQLFNTDQWWFPNQIEPTDPSKSNIRRDDDMAILNVDTGSNYCIMPDGAVKLTDDMFWDLAGGGMQVIQGVKRTTAEHILKGPRTYKFNQDN